MVPKRISSPPHTVTSLVVYLDNLSHSILQSLLAPCVLNRGVALQTSLQWVMGYSRLQVIHWLCPSA